MKFWASAFGIVLVLAALIGLKAWQLNSCRSDHLSFATCVAVIGK
jgi:hypothetical protein